MSELLDYVTLKTQQAASSLAQIALNGALKQKLLQDFLNRIKGQGNESQLKGALCLGEFGKLSDLSSVPNIID